MEKLKDEYMQHLYRREGFHLYQEPDGEPFEAEIMDVKSNGHLVLRRHDGGLKKYELKQLKYIL